MCVGVCTCECRWLQRPRVGFRPLELEFQAILNCAGNKNSMCFPAESSLQSWILSLIPRISPSCWTLVFEVGYEESTVLQQHFLKGPWWWCLFPVPRWHFLSIARSLLTVSRHIQFLHQHSAIFQPVLTFQLWDAELFRDSVHSGTLFYSWGPRTRGSWSCPMGSVMVSSGWILQSR